jgi:hypothetical protein
MYRAPTNGKRRGTPNERRAGKMPALRNAKRDGLKPAPTTAARLRRRALRVFGRDGRGEFAGD